MAVVKIYTITLLANAITHIATMHILIQHTLHTKVI